jgi:hypothetical protein
VAERLRVDIKGDNLMLSVLEAMFSSYPTVEIYAYSGTPDSGLIFSMVFWLQFFFLQPTAVSLLL